MIVKGVQRLLSIVDGTGVVLDDLVTRSDGLRRSVLATAFAGKLVPQDPSDEPASVSVTRAKAQRESAHRLKKREISVRQRVADHGACEQTTLSLNGLE